ncbi:MAG: hypothetical protein CMJ67_02620 [Planctomycetaceae bacterium]|nr:hypothetical protein [Planctomycetaceae bacterium]
MNLITAFMIAAAIQASSPDRERFLPSPEAAPAANLASQDPISVGIGQARLTIDVMGQGSSPSTSRAPDISIVSGSGGGGSASQDGSSSVIEVELEPSTTTPHGIGHGPASPPAQLPATPTPPVRLGPGPWMTTWSDVPAAATRMSAMTWIRGNRVGDDSWTSDQFFNAETLNRDLAAQPAGRRTLFPWRYRNALLDHPFDRIRRPDGSTESRPSPFLNAATLSIRNELTPILDQLVSMGAEVDYIIGDIESSGHFACWNIDEAHIEAIMEDPRFATRVMTNGLTPQQMLGDWNANQIKLRTPTAAAAAWNAVMSRLFADAILDSMIRPVVERWPNAIASNYGSVKIDPDQSVPDMNGWSTWQDSLAGTHPAMETYGRLGGVLQFFGIDGTDPTRLIRGSADRLPPEGWTSLRLDVNRTRAMLRSSNRPFHLWLASPSWATDGNWESGFADSPYFRENLFHQAVGGAHHFIYWNPIDRNLPVPIDRDRRHAESLEVQAILEEIDQATRGDASSTPLRSGRIRWDSPVLLSGARLADGSSVWRLTVAPNVASIRLDGDSAPVLIDPTNPGIWIHRPDDSVPAIAEVTER